MYGWMYPTRTHIDAGVKLTHQIIEESRYSVGVHSCTIYSYTLLYHAYLAATVRGRLFPSPGPSALVIGLFERYSGPDRRQPE